MGRHRRIRGATRAFLPQLTRSRGAIVNMLSLLALAPLPLIPAYSISRAAAFFPDPFSQALAEGWRAGVAKALERQNAALLAAAPVPG